MYPLRAGSGMPNKVLDALACGLPSIVSPDVLAALEHARDGEHLRVATDAASWAASIAALLADAPARAALSAQGQALVWTIHVGRERCALARHLANRDRKTADGQAQACPSNERP